MNLNTTNWEQTGKKIACGQVDMGTLDFVTYTSIISQHVFFDYMTPNWIYTYLIEKKKEKKVDWS
jgi:hypothetical protein